MINPEVQGLASHEVSSYALAGFNFPPSQFQLHLQYFVPPFLPHQYQLIMENTIFQMPRWIPIEYVRAVLLKVVEPAAQKFVVDSNTTIESIIEHFDKLGVSYKDIHTEFYARMKRNHVALSNWQPGDFALRLKDGQVLQHDGTAPDPAVSYQEILQADKAILQNYGRPYNEAGKPTGAFYKSAQKDALKEWAAAGEAEGT